MALSESLGGTLSGVLEVCPLLFVLLIKKYLKFINFGSVLQKTA